MAKYFYLSFIKKEKISKDVFVFYFDRAKLGSVEKLDFLADEAMGIVRANVRSAQALSPNEQERLERALARFTGKRVISEVREDPSLLGGLFVKVGDYYFEHSVRHETQRLQEILTGQF